MMEYLQMQLLQYFLIQAGIHVVEDVEVSFLHIITIIVLIL